MSTGANEATAALSEMVLSNRVVVTWTKKDRYRRIIGTLFMSCGLSEAKVVMSSCSLAKEQSINAMLVANGHAWQYTKYSKSKTLGKTQTSAQEQKLGLWKADNPIAPWVFRKKR